MKISMTLYVQVFLCFQRRFFLYVESAALQQPTIIDSENGLLDITLTLKYETWTLDGTSFALRNTRLFDGKLPGNTLRISPGDTVKILYQNQLELQSGAVNSGVNVFSYPDHSNIHFHGGHVSGELPSDDVTMKIPPQSSYQYETVFPANHMGGTHWMHPHVHGASTVQVGGGAACALIVKDEDGFLPIEVSNAAEVVLMIQDMNPEELAEALEESGDSKTTIATDSNLPNRSFRIVNGQYQPSYDMTINTWYRFRMINAGFERDSFDLSISGCDMRLLAKDGVYIRNFPRTITSAQIPTGGRADVMVRCTSGGTFTMRDYASQTVMTLAVSGSASSTELTSWVPTYPNYLTDLRSSSVTTGCSCTTQIDGCFWDGICINGRKMDEDFYVHTVPFGSIAERTLRGVNRHPYHQHVYPFQIITNLDGMSTADANYFQVGDWHDVFFAESGRGGMVTRYKADVHMGKMMVHCHILEHEDQGAMSQELIAPASESCDCGEEPGFFEDVFSPVDEFLGCFSSMATVVEEQEGKIKLKDVIVGQKVLTGDGQFKTVYAIDHKDPNERADFLQIYYENENNTNESQAPLELTPNHMIFVQGQKEPMPASSIQIGNKLETMYARGATVTKISSVKREGVWNPLTVDGTILVDGIVTSTYSVTFKKKKIADTGIYYAGRCNLPISQHSFMHLLTYPYRVMCLSTSLSLCETDSTKTLYSLVGASILKFASKQHLFIKDTMLVTTYIGFSFLNLLMHSLTIVAILGFIYGCRFLKHKKKCQ